MRNLNWLLPCALLLVLANGNHASGQTPPSGEAAGKAPSPKPKEAAQPPQAPEPQVPEEELPSGKRLPDSARPLQDGGVNTSKAQRSPYIIGPEDVLYIKVWDQGNLSGPVTVGPDGMISLQLIDEVKADGLTPQMLKAVLTEKLKKFIVTPEVNVQVLGVHSRKYIIQGEVGRPGTYPLIGPTTVMEALVNGGRFNEFANPKKIYVLRSWRDPQTKQIETKKFNFNYKEVSHGKRMEQNIQIQNGDQIFVP